MNCLAILMGLATSISSAVEVSSEQVGNIFTDSDQVEFRVKVGTDATFSVTDYEDRRVFKQDVPAGESVIELGTLSRGHYTIAVRNGDVLLRRVTISGKPADAGRFQHCY